MPISPRQDFLTPFADEAMRLLREEWPGKYGTKMLSEELFAILQAKIPITKSGPLSINVNFGTDQTAITLRQFGDGDFMQFTNKLGQIVGSIDQDGNFQKTTPQERRKNVTRETPEIQWSNPADITDGTPLSSSELNAVAVDAISGYELAGTYQYSPDSGTVLSVGNNQNLNVVFSPTNSEAYKRARKTVQINVTAPPLTYLGAANSQTFGTTLDRTVSVNAGDLLLVFTGSNVLSTGLGGTTFTVADDQLNSYTQIDATLIEDYPTDTHIALGCFWAKVASTGTVTVTSTASAPCQYALTTHRISGQDPAAPIRAFSTNTEHQPTVPGVATTGSVGAVAGDMIIADFLGPSGGVLVAISPYVGIINTGTGTHQRHENVAGSESATATNPGDGIGGSSYVAFGVAIKPP